MAEESKTDKYIICSKCKSKYINDEEHISKDFGYTRLEERYKTCVRCRARNKVNCKTYYNNHIDQVKERNNKYYQEHVEEKKAYFNMRATCEYCGSEVAQANLARHTKTNKCKLMADSKNKQIM